MPKASIKTTRRAVSVLPPVAVVVSRYNATVTDPLLSGAVRAYQRAGGAVHDLYIAEAPGAFELVALSSVAARSGSFAGVLALGCIIKGETRHDEVLGDAVTQGLANLSLVTGVPVGLGVLTVKTPAQARDRAGGKHGNKGAEAMEALLLTIAQAAMLADPAAVERARRGGAAVAKVMGGLGGGVVGRPDKLAGALGARKGEA
jgi:6,7-dimethyl-8-ribityllumazine synthase